MHPGRVAPSTVGSRVKCWKGVAAGTSAGYDAPPQWQGFSVVILASLWPSKMPTNRQQTGGQRKPATYSHCAQHNLGIGPATLVIIIVQRKSALDSPPRTARATVPIAPLHRP